MKKCFIFWVVFLWVSIIFLSSALPCDPKDKKITTGSGVGPVFTNPVSGWSHLISLESNNYDPDCNPWITADGKKLFFISTNINGPPRPGHQGEWDIYMAEWDTLNNRWGAAVNLGPNVNTPTADRRPSTNPKGDTLYFSRGGEIWRSTWNGSIWTPAIKLPPPVNTLSSSEEDPAISFDGRKLYFVSNRPGGFGGGDIWVVRKTASGGWDSLTNVGPPVNTQYNEVRPFISADGQKLFFSDFGGQPRPGGYGSADIWFSTWDGSAWSEPVNMGPPINTDLITCTPFMMPDGKTFYASSESFEGSRGDEDVWVSFLDSLPSPKMVTGDSITWVKCGELEGAWNVYALAEGKDSSLYAGTSPRGKVYKSTDKGIGWIPTAPLPGAIIVYSLLAAQNGDIYAGTYPLGDVFKSIDGGNSWTNTSDLPGASAVRALIETKDGKILAGAYAGNGKIFSTTDGGTSWNLLATIPGLGNGIFCLFQAKDSSLYAGGWGVPFKSTDGGNNWTPLSNFPFPPNEGRSINSITQVSDGNIYATGWIHGHGGYVFKSTNGGTTWDTTGRIMAGPVHAVRVYDLLEDSDGTFFIGFQTGPDSVVFYSKDKGATWKNTGPLRGTNEVLCFLKSSDGFMYAGTTPNGDVFKKLRLRGDANSDGKVTISDVVFVVNYLFKGGFPPSPLSVGDVNCDASVNVSDVVYLVNYLFKGGPAPCVL